MSITVVKTVVKAPSDVLPIWMEWKDWLAYEAKQLGLSVTIATSTWTATGVTIDGSPAPAIDGTKARCWISGGSSSAWAESGPANAVLVNRITTDRGHDVSRSILVRVGE